MTEIRVGQVRTVKGVLYYSVVSGPYDDSFGRRSWLCVLTIDADDDYSYHVVPETVLTYLNVMEED